MFARSYKYYLNILEKSSKASPVQKFILIIVAAFFILIGIFSSSLYYLYQKEAPIRTQGQYLELANGGFNAIEQSLGEILSSYQVAGAKAQIIDTSKESSPSASGYFVSLDDVQKIMSSLEKVKSDIDYQKGHLQEQKTPQKYTGLHNDLLNFYAQTGTLLSSLADDQKFLKDMLMALGPDFYLPVLTNQKLWTNGNKDEIINYYEKNKSLANVSFTNLSKTSPAAKFKPFYDAQIAYFEVVVKVSDNIISTLKQNDTVDKDAATQLEKAYQILIGAQRENEKYADKLTEEKLKIFDLKKNLQDFSPVSLPQNSLRTALNDHLTNQPQPKFDKIPNFIKRFL
ncbi:hypothetical protein A3D81_02030 [Candidatus Curtissbacteria bacterium RIFCSPHIGHO2_02_FULL_40_17]|uniref:Uncharacterized protein n=4 Tax=Candidatus Curtissiibacteriota TaxID=1752717 RepID=A0A1F5GGW5_9BACT|nr:MAG: hypothetical protein A2693_03485 [Candidatus Curtissbacteria bacterium RIFCSPHIGHO2_01_FULL_40_12]OGD91069.1 MAG: hypothetical protein A3D81_02030 [Candidatus Curtissbacteria bacterium RIFCSPHIGHO2_02_FULL_40_17]OGE05479.1 MAG: hypothetical protein A3F45_03820 [Candidatus Curtissbacteria bacterium RIFCSPHIGHO2_12_FULL_41_17]OGE07119.1 MAG: hypothetical protein A3I53_02880 [Candidatus Curtissbacteria bacterium RIFCSPLOWO2_02_FULL_40_13b]